LETAVEPLLAWLDRGEVSGEAGGRRVSRRTKGGENGIRYSREEKRKETGLG
jgi:hypothetical protein